MIFRLKYAEGAACDFRPSLQAACGVHNVRPIHPVCKSVACKRRQHLSVTQVASPFGMVLKHVSRLLSFISRDLIYQSALHNRTVNQINKANLDIPLKNQSGFFEDRTYSKTYSVYDSIL